MIREMLIVPTLMIQFQQAEFFKPRNVTVTELTPYTISLSWSGMQEDLNNQYQILYWPSGITKELKRGSTYEHMFTIENLKPGDLYTIWLVAIRGNLTSDYVTLQQRTGKIMNKTALCMEIQGVLVILLPSCSHGQQDISWAS